MKHVPLLAMFLTSPVMAGAPVVEKAAATCNGQTCTFSVTISHADTGWDHYADGWGVYTTDGKELGYRVLHHPHVNEQPFTRSLGGVQIPQGVTKVVIVPRDSVHKLGEGVEISLP